MKSVEPIRDKKKIDAMKAILASGKYGQRNLVLFSIGINTAYRISDLRQLKLSDVLEISRGRVIVKERLAMKEQKTAKHNSVFISNKFCTSKGPKQKSFSRCSTILRKERPYAILGSPRKIKIPQ